MQPWGLVENGGLVQVNQPVSDEGETRMNKAKKKEAALDERQCPGEQEDILN